MTPEFDFDGSTYDHEKDGKRLSTQLVAVWNLMRDGSWRSLASIVAALPAGHSESAVSARLRDFRKARFGGHTVERRRAHGGTFVYRLVPNGELVRSQEVRT
jgi:hypothetical protein